MSNNLTRAYRLENIDMLRGLVIIIMAIDHVRDLFMFAGVQDPMKQADIPTAVFFTRWITHFCAPVFVFLAGTSAGLMAGRKSKKVLGAFLLKRGLWLILVEITIITTAYTFAQINGVPQLGNQVMITLQVIWAIGASMVVLAGFQFLGSRTCLYIGLVIILSHNLLDSVWPTGNLLAGNDPFWYSFYSMSSTSMNGYLVATGYPIIPWIGVMLCGYGSAFIFQKEAGERDRILVRSGLAMIMLFIIIRALDIYGDPNHWEVQETFKATLFDFLNVSKYPPSLLFLLATLGPMTLVCAYSNKVPEKVKKILVMFGRVPFAFYVGHWYLIRFLSFGLGVYQGFELNEMMTFFFFLPKGYGISLSGVYVVWILVLLLMYPFCKKVANLKARRKDWWLSYV